MRTMIGAACALGLALGAPCGAAATPGDPVWVRSAAPNGDFTVETTCTASEIAGLASTPNALKIQIVPQSRVLCVKDGLMYMAASWEIANLPAGGGALFDQLWAGIDGNPDAKGRPIKTMINGRRAITNREIQDGVVSQTGFIEMGPNKVLFLAAGGQDSSASVEGQGQSIDRFFGSTKVTAK